jgi:hypothetical protein
MMTTRLTVAYSTITQVFHRVPSYYVQQGDGGYTIISTGEEITAQCNLLGSDSDNITDFETNHKDSLQQVDSPDDADLLGALANNIPLVSKRNSDGITLSSTEPRVGTELTAVSHNFCNATTWYTDSIRIEEEVLTDSGDGLTWASEHTNWIDLYHGIMYDEERVVRESEHGYTILVTVDDVPMTQRAPFTVSGGDYDVDYADGTITFFSSQAGKSVKATYSYATTSVWKLIPKDGYYIDIESVEAQFSADTVMRDSVQFDVWAYNPYDLPNKFPVSQTTYKTMRNFVDEAIGSYPVVPEIAGDHGRGSASIYGFPFRYGTVRRMNSSYGVELRARLTSDIPFGGEHTTATFYCTVKQEGT